MNTKFIVTIVTTIILFLVNLVLSKLNIAVPDEVKLAVVGFLVYLIGRYTRLWITEENKGIISDMKNKLENLK